MTAARFEYLLNKWLNDHLTPEEVEEFLGSLHLPIAEVILGDSIIQLLKNNIHQFNDEEENNELIENILSNLNLSNLSSSEAPRKRIPLKRWISMAAAILLIPFIGYLGLNYNKTSTSTLVDTAVSKTDFSAPTDSYAILIMPDGSKLNADIIKDSMILTEFGLKLKKLPNGDIQYISLNKSTNKELITKVDNPRKSKPLSIVLDDGTKVLLNVESSISYPIIFNELTRKVQVTGEAYFEVAKQSNKNFIVQTNKVNTEVLGTEFNVRSYDNENEVKVTLLEGSIKVLNNQSGKENILIPLQQAQFSDNLTTIEMIDPDEVMSWKNGIISFNNSNIKTIMHELSRWYDVEVEYLGEIPDKRYTGRISSSTNLNNVLEILKEGGMSFQLKDRTIIISP